MDQQVAPFELENYLPYRITRLSDLLTIRLARQYKNRFGISVAEWRVLVNLGFQENVSIREIERPNSLEKSKVSRTVTKLENKGLLTKAVDRKDRRLLKLTLTAEGRDLLGELIALATAFQAELEAVLGDHLDPLEAAIERVTERLG